MFSIGEGEKLFSDQNIQKLQNNYNSIAIIGCQSSGKSTLLNRLFKTDFQEMDSENGRNQTTQGLWLSVASDVSTIIIDCEGTDSKERGENRLQFENCSSLFCLALSDVLLMNMWTQDVGRYTASNYNVLKMVFEMNLKLFQQSCAKKIVVILRDYNAQICKKEKFEQLIMKDINTLWADIKKPEQFKDSSPATFFQFEFITLPHKIYEEDNFNKEVDEIRKRFDTRHEKYFFDHTKGSKGVPVDGYIKYCESVWDTIIHEKDLNIPSQKEMLAIYRCNEIKEEAYNTVRKELVDFKNKSATSRISKFSELVLGMYNKCINYYDSIARNYLQKVYEETRNSLHLNLIHELYIAFTNQINRILPVALKFFSKDLESELQKGSNFFQTVTQVKAEHLEKLKKNIAEIRVFDDWEISISEFEEQFDNAIDAAKKSCLEKLSKEIEESLKLQIDEILSERLDGDIDVNFWLNFNQEYCTLIYNKLFAFKNTLFEYYKLDNIVIENCLKELEINIRKAVTRNIEKKTKELSNFALDHFKKIFHYDNNKLPRKWDRLQENEIDEIYSKSIKQTEILFVLFSQIKLINNPLKDSK